MPPGCGRPRAHWATLLSRLSAHCSRAGFAGAIPGGGSEGGRSPPPRKLIAPSSSDRRRGPHGCCLEAGAMNVLGIESSCDETAAAVLADGCRILSSVVASQDLVHAPYGGVVPELASRRHVEVIVPVVESALADAGVKLRDLDAGAGTPGPRPGRPLPRGGSLP